MYAVIAMQLSGRSRKPLPKRCTHFLKRRIFASRKTNLLSKPLKGCRGRPAVLLPQCSLQGGLGIRRLGYAIRPQFAFVQPVPERSGPFVPSEDFAYVR